MADTLLETMTQDSPAGLVVPIGTELDGQDFSLDLARSESLLISYPKWMTIDPTIIRNILDYMLAKNKPEEMRLILVDLCEVGLKSYDGDDHLLTPVIEEVERVISAHQWINKEIQKRLDLFAQSGVKSIEEYNLESGFTAMEYILVVDVDISEMVMAAPSYIYGLMERIMPNARMTGFIMTATTKHPRDLMSKLYRNRITYSGNDEVGIVNYLPYGSSESKKIRLTDTI
ncbi:MAG: FtsK/SpoIIIE domain-containing protein [bacterium]